MRKGRRAPRPPLAPSHRWPASSSERLSDWATQVPIALPSFLPAAKINARGEPEGGCWRGAGGGGEGDHGTPLRLAERPRGRSDAAERGRGRGRARHLATRWLCGARGCGARDAVHPPA